MATTTHTVTLAGMGPVEVTVDEHGPRDSGQDGDRQPYLLLHGGAGPQSMSGFGELLANSYGVRTIMPIHPGFGGTPRPDALSGISGLAGLYLALLEQLDLTNVAVIGNSIGGWITAELACTMSPRLGSIVLIDAVGIDVSGHPVADVFSLALEQVFALSFHDPAPFRIDPAALPAAAQAIAAGNRAALAAYTGGSMSDPTLTDRLAGLQLPALVLWGDSDQIADPDYGRSYAAAIPGASYRVLIDTGHMPQLETPEQTLEAIWTSRDTVLRSTAPPT